MVLKNVMCGNIGLDCAYAMMSYWSFDLMTEDECRDRCPNEWDAGFDEWQDPCVLPENLADDHWDNWNDDDHWDDDHHWDDDDHWHDDHWSDNDHWDNWNDDDHWDDEHRDQTLDDLWDDHAVSEHFE